MQLKMALTFMLECPLYNSIEDEITSMFQNAAVGNPKSFYQLDHEIGNAHYLTKTIAFHHSKKISHFDPHHDVLYF